MLQNPLARAAHWRRTDVRALARRLAHFWIVWTLLLLVHEGGHAVSAWRQGLEVRRVTVGMGPVLWRTAHEGTQLVVRAVPLAGVTNVREPREAAVSGAAADAPAGASRGQVWGRQVVTLAGGVLATLALAAGVAAIVLLAERGTRRRWVWGRIVVADAVVLTVFNFLPVPPLDGGRAVLGAVAALTGAPLTGDALLWVQIGGLALAVVPMALWTRWTRRIDAAALWWGAPRHPDDRAPADAAPADAAPEAAPSVAA